MNKLTHFFSLIASLLMIVACEQMNPTVNDSALKVNIVATVGDYTKATDTSFEEGDAIGVYILNPNLVLNNGKFKMTGGKMQPNEAYSWYEDASISSVVIGYYPYIQNISSYDNLEFTVNADQSTHSKYTASDLMFAIKSDVKPSNEPISLQFHHALSKIQVIIDNQLSDAVKDVYIADVYGAAKVNIANQSVELSGSQGQIKMAPTTQSGKDIFAAIVIPQTAKPRLLITTESGKQLSYDLAEEVIFNSGKVRTSNILINSESIITEITSDITNWTDDNDLNFKREDDEDAEWKSLGKGLFLDNIMTSVFEGVYHSEWEVEIEESTKTPGVYRILNPYAASPDFEDCEGDIIINASNPDKVYIEPSAFVVYGYTFKLYSYIDAYFDDTNDVGYGALKDGVISFTNKKGTVIYYNGESSWTNLDGIFTITLPGYSRPVKYGGIDPSESTGTLYTKAFTRGDGAKCAEFKFFSYIDNSLVKYMVFEGRVSSDSDTTALQMLNGEISAETMEFNDKRTRKITIEIPIWETGEYTIVIATIAPDGSWWYRYERFYYLVDGEEAPSNDMKISSQLSEAAPDMAVKIHISNYVSNYYPHYLIYEKGEYINPSFEFVYNNEKVQYGYGVTTEMGSDKGCDFIIQGLLPDTEYTIAVATENNYGVQALATTDIRTAPAPVWKKMEGKGTFFDNTPLFKFVADVEFEYVEGKERYRVIKPYSQYWEEHTENYTGSFDQYLEFYVEVTNGNENVHFLPYHTGRIEPELNAETVLFEDIFDNSQSRYTFFNRRIEPGVFNISPIYNLSGSGYYPYNKYDGVIHIALPGYTDPLLNQSTKAMGVKINTYEDNIKNNIATIISNN